MHNNIMKIQVSYLANITSDIQTQLTVKLNLAGGNMSKLFVFYSSMTISTTRKGCRICV